MYNPSAALLDGPMDTYPPPPVSQDPYQAHQDIQEAYPPVSQDPYRAHQDIQEAYPPPPVSQDQEAYPPPIQEAYPPPIQEAYPPPPVSQVIQAHQDTQEASQEASQDTIGDQATLVTNAGAGALKV